MIALGRSEITRRTEKENSSCKESLSRTGPRRFARLKKFVLLAVSEWSQEFPGGFAGRFGWFYGNGNSKGANGDEFFERQWWSADDLDALVDLYHRLNWIRLRHLRIADAAADYQAGDLGAQRPAD